MTSTIETITTKTNHPYYLRTLMALATLAVVMSLLVVSAARPAHAATTFTVNSTADFFDANTADGVCNTSVSGGPECTLRAAIQQANATSGADTINFDIPGSEVHTIRLKGAPPELKITEKVTIDGYTQPGASPNTLTQGTNAVLKIELDGTNAGSGKSGLFIGSGGSDSVIRGLVINRFSEKGIRVISASASRVGIEGNFIGTDPSGTIDLGNGRSGVEIFDSTSNTVGGTSPAARNLISGNGFHGVDIKNVTTTASFNNRVLGNLIGTKKDATTALGNFQSGVGIASSSNNTLFGNTIAFNGQDGVVVVGPSDEANSNLLFGNSIFSNGDLGIDLANEGVTANDLGSPPDPDTGPNDLQNFPVLSSAKTTRKGTTITGTLNSTPNKDFSVRFFSNASGDEGQKPIGQVGVTTDDFGNASFTFKPTQKVPKGQFITATATDTSTNNTSEFSAAKKVARR